MIEMQMRAQYDVDILTPKTGSLEMLEEIGLQLVGRGEFQPVPVLPMQVSTMMVSDGVSTTSACMLMMPCQSSVTK